MKYIPYSCQSIDDDDIGAVTEVMRSPWLTQGPVVTQFEESVSAYCGATYTIAVSSGTAALHIACIALNLGPDDYLWTSPLSFSASSNCGLYCGAQVDFVDIDLQTGNISIVALTNKLEKAKRESCLPKILVVVHYAGQPCDMETIYALSLQYGFKIIEDAAQSFGAEYDQKKIGFCQYSECCIFSLHPAKTFTSAEGGLITCQDEVLYKKLALLKTHGIVLDPEIQATKGGWYRNQTLLGYNYRMSDIHAALGMSQLKKCDQFVTSRQNLAQFYHEQLKDFYPIQFLDTCSKVKTAWHLFVILLDDKLPKNTRHQLYNYLHEHQIGVQVHYIPIFQHHYYKQFGYDESAYPNTISFYERCLSLPLYPKLTLEEQNFVITKLKDFFKKSKLV